MWGWPVRQSGFVARNLPKNQPRPRLVQPARSAGPMSLRGFPLRCASEVVPDPA